MTLSVGSMDGRAAVVLGLIAKRSVARASGLHSTKCPQRTFDVNIKRVMWRVFGLHERRTVSSDPLQLHREAARLAGCVGPL